MDNKIEIDVRNTAQDYRRVLLSFYVKKIVVIGILYLIVVVPMIWLAFFGAGANPFQEKNNSVVLVMVFFVLLPIFICGGIVFNIWKQAANIGKTLEPDKFVFSSEGLQSFSKSSNVQVTWDAIQGIKELKEDFLFYPQKNIFYTIPKRSFQSDLQVGEFRNLVREKLGSKAELKN